MSFMNCLRCRSYVVTGDDLHKLFSFYWRILNERREMDHRIWKKRYSHIVRLIERDVIEEGVATGIFKREKVEEERQRAKIDPHKFWDSSSILIDLQAAS